MNLTLGDSPDTAYLRVKVTNITGVVMAVIRQGGVKQAAIADKLGMAPDVFSKKFGEDDDCFYRALEQLGTIMAVTKQVAPIEYWAYKFGYKLVPITQADAVPRMEVDDAIGKKGLAKP